MHPRTESQRPPVRPRRALVADDDEVNLKMLDRILRSWGYETRTASDGVGALAILEGEDPPDVAVLDWMMPGLSGPDVCRALDAQGVDRPHVVVLTARASSHDLVEALDAGADDYVTKPIDLAVLRARVERGFRRRPPSRFTATPGSVLAGRYRLERTLGQGGMGAVWAATHLGLSKGVAVKLLRADGAEVPNLRERFEREAKALAAITSDHVVRVLDYGVENGVPYLVMEQLDGESLEDRLAGGTLELDEVVDITRQMARGLDAAHAAGVLHRDIKPANVFLTNGPAGRTVKLIDFGLARPTEEGPTFTGHGQILGTVGFMSPRQIMGDPATPACDLWACAATVVAMLTGRSPFEAAIASASILLTIQGPPPAPSEQRSDLPAAIDAWAARAFRRETPGFATASALAEAFAEAARG